MYPLGSPCLTQLKTRVRHQPRFRKISGFALHQNLLHLNKIVFPFFATSPSASPQIKATAPQEVKRKKQNSRRNEIAYDQFE